MFFKPMIGFLLVLSLSCVTPTVLWAAAPELSQVPAGCTGEATLRGERERLVAQMKDVMASVKANKARCSSVESGSDLEADCRQEGKRIKRRYSELIEKYKAFNESVLNQGNPEHIARGQRYVDCDSARKLYEQMSVGLPVQRDWLDRTKTQLESATHERKAISKEQEEFLIKSTYDNARALMWKMDILQARIRKMKMDGIPLVQRKVWEKTMKKYSDTYDRLDKGVKSFEAGGNFGNSFHVAGKDARDIASELGMLLDKSGIGDEGIKELAHLLPPAYEIGFIAGKLFIDAGFLDWKNNVNEAELARAQATYDTLKFHYDQAQEKVDNAKSDLAQFCNGKTH